jgi:hypothetical protein
LALFGKAERWGSGRAVSEPLVLGLHWPLIEASKQFQQHYWSPELERNEHLSPVLKQQTVERIVSVLASTDTGWGDPHW